MLDDNIFTTVETTGSRQECNAPDIPVQNDVSLEQVYFVLKTHIVYCNIDTDCENKLRNLNAFCVSKNIIWNYL